MKKLKIAILHEMLVKLGGAEKVVQTLQKTFPDADLYTLIYDEKKVGKIFPKDKITVAKNTQKIYKIFKNQRFCLPFMKDGVESFDFAKYDLVIASSSGFAHGAITKPDTKFVVYYHSPARYLWDWTNEYKKQIGANKGFKGLFLNKLFLKLRQWDYIASQRNDVSIANSLNVATRIKKYYKKKSQILYPPVNTQEFKIGKSGDYYIIVSAITEFKKIDIAINIFNKMPEKKLKIIGTGNYLEELKKISTSKNIEFLGRVDGKRFFEELENSKGFIFAGEEDFGIAPIEAMACGKPVFALNAGGLKETNIAGITGEFFENSDGSDAIEKFEKFDQNIDNQKYNSKKIKKHADSFSEKIFIEKLKKIIDL